VYIYVGVYILIYVYTYVSTASYVARLLFFRDYPPFPILYPIEPYVYLSLGFPRPFSPLPIQSREICIHTYKRENIHIRIHENAKA